MWKCKNCQSDIYKKYENCPWCGSDFISTYSSPDVYPIESKFEADEKPVVVYDPSDKNSLVGHLLTAFAKESENQRQIDREKARKKAKQEDYVLIIGGLGLIAAFGFSMKDKILGGILVFGILIGLAALYNSLNE